MEDGLCSSAAHKNGRESGELDKMLEKLENQVCQKTVARIREYIEHLEGRIKTLEEGSDARCQKMLGQALSGSDEADVEFIFDGKRQGRGLGSVRGHRGMLCAGSEEYAGMFRSGMVEEKEGRIRVPPGVGVESFRGFLEWLYLGERGFLFPFMFVCVCACACVCVSVCVCARARVR